jgi:hypothetical protein
MNQARVTIQGPITFSGKGRGYIIDATVSENEFDESTYKTSSASFFMPVSGPGVPAKGATKTKRKRRK